MKANFVGETVKRNNVRVESYRLYLFYFILFLFSFLYSFYFFLEFRVKFGMICDVTVTYCHTLVTVTVTLSYCHIL